MYELFPSLKKGDVVENHIVKLKFDGESFFYTDGNPADLCTRSWTKDEWHFVRSELKREDLKPGMILRWKNDGEQYIVADFGGGKLRAVKGEDDLLSTLSMKFLSDWEAAE
jgi:hypothetical protein